MRKYFLLAALVILPGCVSNPYDKLEQVAKTCDATRLKGYIHKDETLHVEIECSDKQKKEKGE